MGQFPGGASAPVTQSSNDDKVTWLKSIAGNLSSIYQVLNRAINSLGSTGTVTLAAAASTVVQNTNVKTTPPSRIFLTPANASAATLVGSVKSPYAAAADFSNGVSFTIKTANAAAAAGTEVFSYRVDNSL